MEIINLITEFINPYIQSEFWPVIQLFFLTIIITFYGIFIFFFYKFLAKKNIIELNLGKYNKYNEGPFLKILAIILYIIEYIIILPIVTFFWFTVLSILIFILSEGLEVGVVLLISAALVSSVRVVSYISSSLSQDIAKMLPLTLLGIALTRPGFFDFTTQLSRLSEIPTLVNSVIYFLVFIIVIEFLMRIYDLVKNLKDERNALKTNEQEQTEEEAE